MGEYDRLGPAAAEGRVLIQDGQDIYGRPVGVGAAPGDGGAAAREDARQEQQRIAIARINEIFGYTEPVGGGHDRLGPADVGYTEPVGGGHDRLGPADVGYDRLGIVAGVGEYDRLGPAAAEGRVLIQDGQDIYGRPVGVGAAPGDGGAAAREDARQEQQRIAIARINEIFGIEGGGADSVLASDNRRDREALYGTVRGDVINYNRLGLDRQKADARRDVRFSLAERGLTGGSVDIDQNRELQDRYMRGVLDITNRGDAAANQIRSADERTRLDMISRINAGADAGAVTAGAMNALEGNARAARDEALGQNSRRFFDDVAFLQRARSDYVSGQELQRTLAPFFRAPSRAAGAGKITIGGG
ncbi:MAG: hypothetical protein DDT19_02590 [Syntrophomonadaceae bacterium]|nr:hypothetical protein [Bacillota bacterium]